MIKFQRFEFAILATVTAILFLHFTDWSWWWLIIAFALDISMFGYLFNLKFGAAIYNSAHNLVIPSIMLITYVIYRPSWLLAISLLWFFHVFFDRAFGFGLKFPDAFSNTHLGKIGKK